MGFETPMRCLLKIARNAATHIAQSDNAHFPFGHDDARLVRCPDSAQSHDYSATRTDGILGIV